MNTPQNSSRHQSQNRGEFGGNLGHRRILLEKGLVFVRGVSRLGLYRELKQLLRGLLIRGIWARNQ